MNRQEFDQIKNKLVVCPNCLARMRLYNLRKHLQTYEFFLSDAQIEQIIKEVIKQNE